MNEYDAFMVSPMASPTNQESLVNLINQVTSLPASTIQNGQITSADGKTALNLNNQGTNSNSLTVYDGNGQIRLQAGLLSQAPSPSTGDYGLEVWNGSGEVIFTAAGGSGVNISTITGTSAQFAEFYSGTSGQGSATQISGNYITTGRIDASIVDVSNLNANNITVNTINGSQISSSTITGLNIANSTITPGKLSVSSLSAISAVLGSVTVGGSGATQITVYNSSDALLMEISNKGIIVANQGSPGINFNNSGGSGTPAVIFSDGSNNLTIRSGAANTMFFQDNAGANDVFVIDTSGRVVQIGGGGSTAMFYLVPRTFSEGSGGTDGYMYYDTSTNTIRAYINGGWRSLNYT